MSKEEIRNKLLNNRADLAETTRSKHSAIICESVFSTLNETDQSIGVYLATQYEVNLNALINSLWISNREVYVPTVISNTEMNWHLFSCWEDCVTGKFDIQTSSLEKQIALSNLDVLIMPCVGFDRTNFNRIGMGGGFYDRALQNLDQIPRKIGVAFSVQEYENLIAEPWDIPFDIMVTEIEIIRP